LIDFFIGRRRAPGAAVGAHGLAGRDREASDMTRDLSIALEKGRSRNGAPIVALAPGGVELLARAKIIDAARRGRYRALHERPPPLCASPRAPAMSAQNPFPPADPERRALWEMLVRRDFESFLAADWSAMEPDFWAEGFCGIDAHGSVDPARWTIAFPTVESYRDEWLRQARQFEQHRFAGLEKLAFLFAVARLERIEIVGPRALAHKKFDGQATTVDGQTVTLRFQSIFHLVRIENRWKIAGFVGYLPNPMGQGGG
jgi:hypothetical protein